MDRDEFKFKTRQLIADWDGVLNPPDRFTFFENADKIPPFDLESLTEFSPTNAWWLGELCRLAYTPDAKESGYFKNRKQPVRASWLEPQTTFREVHSIHKTGNHASIYLGETEAGKRFTVLCFRGSSRLRQWIMNFTAMPQEWAFANGTCGHSGAYVHAGFDILAKRIWPQLHEKLMSLPRPFIFTGHSLGGALATLAAVEEKPDLLLTFGAPKVGNPLFYSLIGDTPHFRLINSLDLVPHVPPADPGMKNREFIHSGQRIFLTESGNAVPEDDPAGNTNAISHLRDAFRQSTPPACIVDHLMWSYCRKLRAQIDRLGD